MGDMAKYGFFIVIVEWPNGTKSLWDTHTTSDVDFTSTRDVAVYVADMRLAWPSNKFYSKYVSWSEYD